MGKAAVLGLLTAGLLVGRPWGAVAQTARPSRGPTLVLEPGWITSRFLDQPPPEGADTQFLARFLTVIPVVRQRLTVPLIVEWTPFRGDGGRLGQGKNNTPSLLWGLSGIVFETRYAKLGVSALFDYAPDPTGNSNFAHQLVAEGGLYLSVGRWLRLPGNWLWLSSYTSFRYQLTGRPAVETNPAFHRAVLLYGVSLPVAPWGYR
jgi:hypothetical protein